MRNKVRFDKLIEVKENLLSEKKKELELVMNSLEMVTEEISSVEDDIRKNYARLSLINSDSNEIYILRERIVWLEGKKSALLNEKNQLTEKIENLKIELSEILKEIKILETLKSKVVSNIKKALSKKEQKQLDELSIKLNIKPYQR